MQWVAKITWPDHRTVTIFDQYFTSVITALKALLPNELILFVPGNNEYSLDKDGYSVSLRFIPFPLPPVGEPAPKRVRTRSQNTVNVWARCARNTLGRCYQAVVKINNIEPQWLIGYPDEDMSFHDGSLRAAYYALAAFVGEDLADVHFAVRIADWYAATSGKGATENTWHARLADVIGALEKTGATVTVLEAPSRVAEFEDIGDRGGCNMLDAAVRMLRASRKE